MSYFDQRRRASDRRNQEGQSLHSPRFNRQAPQRGPAITTTSVQLGRVKWFNSERGFGFVSLEDGTDVFLHGSVLERSGQSVNECDTVRVGIGQGLKGRQVTEILEVKAAARSPEGRAPAADKVRGVVKWWNERKGFGFVTPETASPDVFVHASTVARAGLSLEQGMPVRIKVRQGAKGPEAIEIASA